MSTLTLDEDPWAEWNRLKVRAFGGVPGVVCAIYSDCCGQLRGDRGTPYAAPREQSELVSPLVSLESKGLVGPNWQLR